MIRIGVSDGERVVEDRGRLVKRNAMPGKILGRLSRIPVELQSMLRLSFTTSQ
jgi:hypothetical protein